MAASDVAEVVIDGPPVRFGILYGASRNDVFSSTLYFFYRKIQPVDRSLGFFRLLYVSYDNEVGV